jgi:tetratricopeptide (TPR) repeat protein
MGSQMRIPLAVALVLLAAANGLAMQKSDAQRDNDRRLALDHYEKGRDAMASERLEDAVAEFKAATGLDPLFSLAYFREGQAHMALKEYAQAEQAFVACRQSYENLAGLQLTNSEEVERRRADEIEQLQNELSMIQSGQNKNPNPSRPQQIQARIAELERNRRKGGHEAAAIPAELNVSLGSAYFRQGKMDLAEKEWRTAAGANPKLGEAHNNLAALYLITQKLDEAEKEVQLAEKAGYHVNPRLKDDIKSARKSSPN